MAQFYVAPLGRPWWRRALDRISRRRPSLKGWTELGILSEDGLQLGELDDAPPCQDYSAAGRPRPVGQLECPKIVPDFDSSKVTLSVDLEDVPKETQYLLFDDVAANLARQLIEAQDAAIRAAIEEARERGWGVMVIGEPFKAWVSAVVPPNTLLYFPKEPTPW